MKNDRTCWLCECPIDNDNADKEHIVPNAIGGRRTVQGFLCRTCNNSTGKSWDADLAKRLNYFGLLFETKRQRGTAPAMKLNTATGDSVEFQPRNKTVIGKPTHTVRTGEKTVQIHVSARTRNEMRVMLEGIKKHYPQIDVDEELKKVQDVETYSSVPVEFPCDISGPYSYRSTVKSAVALACEAGLKPSDCDMAIEYLRNEDNIYDEEAWWEYYQTDLIRNREVGSPLHCVQVTASSGSSLLLAYVEYYGMIRRVICLSKEYSGEPICRTYCVNPVNGQELSNVVVDLDDSMFDVVKAQTREGLDTGLLNAVNQTMKSGMQLSRCRTIARHSLECMKEYCEQNGLVMNGQDRQHLEEKIVQRLAPLIEYYSKPMEFPVGFDPAKPSGGSGVGT